MMAPHPPTRTLIAAAFLAAFLALAVGAAYQLVEARTRAVQLELRRKLGELDERYTVDAALRPVALVRLEAPALALDLDVQRKQAHRLHTVYWNSLTKLFEPLVCAACGCSTFAPTVTNDTVHVLCAPCSRAMRRSEDAVRHDGRSLGRHAQ